MKINNCFAQNKTEIQTFNAKFEKYKGKQLGSSVQALINALRSNLTSNSGSKEKIPTLDPSDDITTAWCQQPSGAMDSGAIETYQKALTTISDKIQRSHTYEVKMEYDGNGLISKITIDY